jgi:CheY-like chemotaxis protein
VGGLETILVVEDEEDVRSATCGILSALGYQVLAAPDAAAADRIVESGEQIDLVFTDVIMPGPVSSLQLGEAVRARLPQAQILYTSGYAEGVLAHEGKLEAASPAAETLSPGRAQRAHPPPARRRARALRTAICSA